MAYFQPTFTNGTKHTPLRSVADYFSGYELTITGNTTCVLEPGCVRAFTADTAISYTGQDPTLPSKMTIDITSIGPLGCYPLPFTSIAVDTSLPVYVLGDSSGANHTTAIVATGNNFLIPGYDVWRRVGTVYVDVSAVGLFSMVQDGSGATRNYVLAEALLAVSGSAATTLTAINFSGAGFPCNPLLTSDIRMNVRYITGGLTDVLVLTPSTFAPPSYPLTIQSPVVGQALMVGANMAPSTSDTETNIYFRNSAVGALSSIWLSGWEESYSLRTV